MPARPDPHVAGGRTRANGRAGTGKASARPVKLSREVIVNAAVSFLDREGWDALTINGLAAQLGTKGPSLYNHVDSLNDLRRAVRLSVIDDIVELLARVGEGRARDDAILMMAGAYRSYAHHHPGRYSAFTRMPLAGEDPEYTAAATAAAAPTLAVLVEFGLEGEQALFAALEFWAALHGFVSLEMTGVMDNVDADTVFADLVRRLTIGMDHRGGQTG